MGPGPERRDPPALDTDRNQTDPTSPTKNEKGLPLVDNPAAVPRSAPPTSEPASSEPAASEPAATTTTAPPGRPTADDVALLAFAQSFELTARDLYQAAIDAGAPGSYSDVFVTLMENHEEYGNVLAGIIGSDAPQRRDDAIFDQFVAGFDSNDTTAVAEAGYDLESTAVATHTELLGQLAGIDGATALAAMLVVESRHCTVLATIAGLGDDMDALIDNAAEALPIPAAAEG